MEVREGELTRLEIELRMQPIALAPVRVEVVPRRGRTANVMHGFYERMEKGRGHHVTREDLEARRPRTLAQALEMVPGIRIVQRQTPFGTRYEVQTGPASIPPQFNQSSNGAACGVVVIWTRMGP